jgi:hypothetical protein
MAVFSPAACVATHLTLACRVLCVSMLQISVSQSLTKGEASDLISEHTCSLAEPAQLQELQVGNLRLAVHARNSRHIHQCQMRMLACVCNCCIDYNLISYGICACAFPAAASCTSELVTHQLS